MQELFWKVVFSLLSFGSIAAIIAPNVPKPFYWLGWLYIFLMLGVGVVTIYAEKIMAWCNKQLDTNKDE